MDHKTIWQCLDTGIGSRICGEMLPFYMMENWCKHLDARSMMLNAWIWLIFMTTPIIWIILAETWYTVVAPGTWPLVSIAKTAAEVAVLDLEEILYNINTTHICSMATEPGFFYGVNWEASQNDHILESAWQNSISDSTNTTLWKGKTTWYFEWGFTISS